MKRFGISIWNTTERKKNRQTFRSKIQFTFDQCMNFDWLYTTEINTIKLDLNVARKRSRLHHRKDSMKRSLIFIIQTDRHGSRHGWCHTILLARIMQIQQMLQKMCVLCDFTYLRWLGAVTFWIFSVYLFFGSTQCVCVCAYDGILTKFANDLHSILQWLWYKINGLSKFKDNSPAIVFSAT